MKRAILIVPIMIFSLGVSTLCADQITQTESHKVVNIRSIADIAAKIRISEEYLERLPAELDETKRKFKELTSMGQDVENKISRYLKFMDTCSTRELEYKGRKMCNSVLNAEIRKKSFEDILNEKRAKVQDAIKFIEREKQRIKAEMSESDVIRDGVAVLNDVKDILTLDI